MVYHLFASFVARRKTLALFAGILLILTGISFSRAQAQPAKPARIGLVYIGPHWLINQIIDGFNAGIAESMGKRPYEIVPRHAGGDKTQISTAVNGAIAAGLDVIATITTPVSQVALKDSPAKLPMVFVGITDPVGAGLVKSLEHPELCTGVVDKPPLIETLTLIKELTPTVKRVGFPFSPDDQPAMYSRQVVEKLAPGLGLKIDARPVTSQDDLSNLIRSLAHSNDAILVGADNALFDAAPTISKTALANRKPYFAADSTSIEAGAVAGVTVDYRQVGIQGARLVARVLAGERAGSIPVKIVGEDANERVLELNRGTIEKLRLTLKENIWSRAKTTFK